MTPPGVHADVAGDHGQVRDGDHVVGAVGVLGDAHGVQDARRFYRSVEPCGLGDQLRVHSGDVGRLLECELLQGRFEKVKILGALGDVLFSGKPLVQDHAHHAHQKGDVGAGLMLQEDVREPAKIDPLGIGDDQNSPVPNGPFDPKPDDGVGLGGVGADGEDGLRVRDLVDGIGHCAAAESRGQTGHRGAVSETRTVIDVVRLHHRSREFLKDVVVFVGGPG